MDVRKYTLFLVLAISILPSVLYLALIWQKFPTDILSVFLSPVVRDFTNIWAAGTLQRLDLVQSIFDPTLYNFFLQRSINPDIDFHIWSYPLPMLLIALPFGYLSLIEGFVLWTAISLILPAVALRMLGLSLLSIAAVLLSPAALENALAGQTGALMSTILIAGLVLVFYRHPVWGGVVLGALLLKPQIAILVPVALIAIRAWQTILSALVTMVLMIVTTSYMYGIEAWRVYVTDLAPHSVLAITGNFGRLFHYQMPTIYMSIRAWGGDYALAYAVQIVFIGVAVVATWFLWKRKDVECELKIAQLLLFAPLATIYFHSYDMLLTAIAIAILIRNLHIPFSIFDHVVLLLLWIWPGIAFMFSYFFIPGFGAPILLLTAVLFWFRWLPAHLKKKNELLVT